MSMQTKRQAIGYILKAALDTELPANRLVDVAWACIDIFEGNEFGNDDTVRAVAILSEQLQLDSDIEKQFRRELYYEFDVKTVEEAGAIFEAFGAIYPVLRKVEDEN